MNLNLVYEGLYLLGKLMELQELKSTYDYMEICALTKINEGIKKGILDFDWTAVGIVRKMQEELLERLSSVEEKYMQILLET